MKKRRTLALALGISVGALVAVASAGRTSNTRHSLSNEKLQRYQESEAYYI